MLTFIFSDNFLHLKFMKMKNKPRIIMLLASLILLSLFIWPMWSITLLAPQYPDGVVMHIYINKIGGSTPGTLQNVNILNHYIGMQKIEPDSIPELKYMPSIVIFLIVFGLVTAIIDKHWLYGLWAITFFIILLIGLYDFYLWEYDYGHNLNPNAPMKFDDASFQPPLIGRKVIINFIAISMPHISGYLAGLSLLLASVAFYLKLKTSKLRPS